MIAYTFKCKDCNTTKKVECSPSEVSTIKVVCDNCNKPMIRDFKASVIVPEYLKSDDVDWVNSRMKNTPSGKKVIF